MNPCFSPRLHNDFARIGLSCSCTNAHLMQVFLLRKLLSLLATIEEYQESRCGCDHDPSKSEYEYATRLLIPFPFVPLCEFGMCRHACLILELVHIVTRSAHNIQLVICHTYLLSHSCLIRSRRCRSLQRLLMMACERTPLRRPSRLYAVETRRKCLSVDFSIAKVKLKCLPGQESSYTPKELALSWVRRVRFISHGRDRDSAWLANQDPKYPRDLPIVVVSTSRSCAPFPPVSIVLHADKKTYVWMTFAEAVRGDAIQYLIRAYTAGRLSNSQ